MSNSKELSITNQTNGGLCGGEYFVNWTLSTSQFDNFQNVLMCMVPVTYQRNQKHKKIKGVWQNELSTAIGNY